MDIVLITTYNRPHLLNHLLNDISREGFDGEVRIYDDCSEEDYSGVEKFEGLNIKYHRFYPNHGKKRYWEMVTRIWKELQGYDFEHVYMLPDDYRLVEGFFDESKKVWNAIPDKIALNTNLVIGRSKNWTNFEPIEEEYDGHKVILSQWVDMCFMAGEEFFEVLDYEIDKIPLSRWERNPNLSSGVGQQISLKLAREEHKMYHVWSSLCMMYDHPSVMNPKERKNNPALSLHR